MIAAQYQASERLDWLGTLYQGGLRETGDVMGDFYDGQGFLIRTDRFSARRTPTGEVIVNPRATAIPKITKPAAAKAYMCGW